MSTLICAATARELSALAPKLFPNPGDIPELQLIQGEVKYGPALFLVTGVGPINAALALGLAFGLTHHTTGSQIQIDSVLLCGLAGAFNLETHPLCSIWHISEEIWPEYGLNDGISVTAKAFTHPLWDKGAQPPVYDRLELAPVEILHDVSLKKASEWGSCASLTVAGVTASFARRQTLWDTWHVPLENMEGFAVAYASARAEVPVVEIRVVSNKTGPRGRGEKDFDGALDTLGQILPDLNLL